MTGSHWHRRLLIAGFLAIIGSVPVVQAVIEIRRDDPVQALELFEQAPTVPHLRAFENRLESESWFADQLRPFTAYWRFQLLGDTGPKALRGRDGWWFYRDGVRYLFRPVLRRSDEQEGIDCALEAIVQFRDELREMNIELLVVPVPGKASIYPDKLTRRLNAPITGGPTRPLIDGLREAGVHVVDLFTAFARARHAATDELLYLPRDTHWTPAGVNVAAQAVAGRALALRTPMQEPVDYVGMPVNIERRGDIVGMLQVPKVEHLYRPTVLRCEQVFSSVTGEPFTSSPDASILVLGDSFCRIYEQDNPKHAGFIAHLALELKQPMTFLINDGGASTLIRQELVRRPELLVGKHLVIWEFVERDVRYGNQGWQRFRLTPVTGPDSHTVSRSRPALPQSD